MKKPGNKAVFLLYILPIIGILILCARFILTRVHSDAPRIAPLSSSQEDSAITIQQKNTEGGGLLQTKQTIHLETVRDGLQDMGFLITEEYYFTEVLTNKKVSSLGILEFGEESYTVSYDGSITAGIDFTQITVDCDEDSKTITIHLPDAQIKDTVIDQGSLQVYNEKHSIFNDFSEEERAQAMLQFEEDVRAKAMDKGILDKADSNARLVIQNFVISMTGADYTVRFEK